MALFRADGRRNIYDDCEKHENNPLKWKTNNRFEDGPATLAHWQSHLRGEQGLALVPILAGDPCWWGCIDIDEYDANPLDIIARAEHEKMPLVPTRSKSGGLRLWLFIDHGAAAKDVQVALRLYVRRLGLWDKTEVFPKQTVLLPDDTGSAVNIPYFGGDFGGKLKMQVGLKKTGAEMTLSEFIRRAREAKASPAQLSTLLAARTPEQRAEDDAQHVPSEEQLAIEPDMCAYACGVMRNDDLSWGEWVTRGMAMWAAFEDRERGFELFEQFSQRSGKYNGVKTREKWREFHRSPPTRIGAGSIYRWADEVSQTWRADCDANVSTEFGSGSGQEGEEARTSASKSDAKVEANSAPTKVDVIAADKTSLKNAPQPEEWPVMGKAAFHGFVESVAPHSETDPVALLIQFLVCFGNVVGREKYYQVESDRHHTNLFAALVGQSSRGRKGTSFNRVMAVAKLVDRQWVDDRVQGGLSSGEGLINVVRDPTMKWDREAQAEVELDHGVDDKRLLVIEPEFAGVLAVMERAGNTISPLIRKAWDGGKLATMTRASPLSATNAHISVIGHITENELRARLTRTDMANGFANRFLFALIRRSKELPFGGELSDSQIEYLGEQLKQIVDDVTACALSSSSPMPPRLTMTVGAREEWARVYSALSAERPGLLGAVTARAEAQAVRLALTYALLDRASQIDLSHLKAGLAVWRYCEASASRIFGTALGDEIADTIQRALTGAGADGISRASIYDLLGRHQARGRISAALALLLENGLARTETRPTGGRSTEMWFTCQVTLGA